MKPRVLVTGVGGRSVGAGILHALMRVDGTVRDRWDTVGTDADPFSWGLYVADDKHWFPPLLLRIIWTVSGNWSLPTASWPLSPDLNPKPSCSPPAVMTCRFP